MGATGALTACSVFREGNGKVPRHERARAGDRREQGKGRRGAERKAYASGGRRPVGRRAWDRVSNPSGSLGLDEPGGGAGQAAGLYGVVPAVPVGIAGLSLFLDVRHFAVRGKFPVAAYHASARKSCEAEEPYEAHNILLVMRPCKQRALINRCRDRDTLIGSEGVPALIV